MKYMMRYILAVCLFGCLGLAASGEASARTPSLRVYNWSDYIDKNIVIDFEARYKTSVDYQTYESINELKKTLARLSHISEEEAPEEEAPEEEAPEEEAPEEKRQDFDVVIMPGFLLKGLIEQNLLAPVQRQRLSNDRHVFSLLIKHLQQVSAEVGQTDIFAMPYLWGTSGLAYNARLLSKRQTDFPRQNWDLLFDPRQASLFSDCGIVIADRPREIFQILKNYLGLPPQSSAREDITKAEITLRKIHPYVDVMNGIDAANALAYGDACIVMAQSQEIFLAQQEAKTIAEEQQGARRRQKKRLPQLSYKFPRQGSLLWMDILVIPAKSPNKWLAHKWIDHLLNAENSRRLAEQTGFATPSRAAFKLLPQNMRSSPVLYPSTKNSKLFMDRETLDANNLPDDSISEAEERAWERFINIRK